MKKYIVPSIPVLLLLITVFCFILCALCYLTCGILLVISDYSEGILWAIFLCVSLGLSYCVLIFSIIGILIWGHFSCRLVKLNNDGLVVGWIKKEHYRWEDITGFGLSALYPSKIIPNGKVHIFISKGYFDKCQIYQKGISGTWDMCMLKKHPRLLGLVNWFKNKLGLAQEVFSNAPDDIFWLPYSDEIYKFLSNKISSVDKQKELKKSVKYTCKNQVFEKELGFDQFVTGLQNNMEYFFTYDSHSIDVAFHYENKTKIYEINIDGYSETPCHYSFMSVDELLKHPIINGKNILELWPDLET